MKKQAILLLLISTLMSVPAQAHGEKLQVIASFTILADVAAQVGGDEVEIQSLMPVNTDPHAFQPAPADVGKLVEADAVLINGINFEEGLIEIIENAGEDMNIVVVSECVDVLPVGDEDHAHESEEHAHSENCEVHHNEIGLENPYHGLGALHAIGCDHAEGDHEHEAGNCDPHVWQNPINVMYWTLLIRDTFSALDPDHADIYAANAAAYLEQLKSLYEEATQLLSAIPEEDRILVTNHDSFSYFAHAFNFEIVATVIPSASTQGDVSAGELGALIDTVLENNVSAIFAESTVNTELAEILANETDAEFYTLYSDSLSDENGDARTYLDMIRANVQIIVEALQ